MRLLRILPQRWQRLVPEMTKFGVIGVINTAIDMAIYNALLSIGPIKASAVSMTVATTSSYLMNRYWTFARRQRSSAPREYVLFFALNLVGFVIQSTPIAFAKYGMHFSEDGTIVDLLAFNIAKIVGIGMGMLFRFWSYRTFVFKAPVEGAAVTRMRPRCGTAAGPAAPPPTRSSRSSRSSSNRSSNSRSSSNRSSTRRTAISSTTRPCCRASHRASAAEPALRAGAECRWRRSAQRVRSFPGSRISSTIATRSLSSNVCSSRSASTSSYNTLWVFSTCGMAVRTT